MTSCSPDVPTDRAYVELPRLEQSAEPSELIEALDRAGCAVVDNLASEGIDNRSDCSRGGQGASERTGA